MGCDYREGEGPRKTEAATSGVDGDGGAESTMQGGCVRSCDAMLPTTTNCERPLLSALRVQLQTGSSRDEPIDKTFLSSSIAQRDLDLLCGSHERRSRRLRCRSDRDGFAAPTMCDGIVPRSSAAAMTSAGRSIWAPSGYAYASSGEYAGGSTLSASRCAGDELWET